MQLSVSGCAGAHQRTSQVTRWGRLVLDVVYIAGTIVFFAFMLAFIHGLERLGRDPGLQDPEHP